jgi:hypothetical protein
VALPPKLIQRLPLIILNTGQLKIFAWYAIAMIMIYPVGIPLVYVSLLFNHREALTNNENMFREESNGYPTTGYLHFLTSAYKVHQTYPQPLNFAVVSPLSDEHI